MKNLNRIYRFFYFFRTENLSLLTRFNLNLPQTQSHNFHLLEEQMRYQELGKKSKPKLLELKSGISSCFPIFLAIFLFGFSFSFINYLWGSLLYWEIFESPAVCTIKHSIFGYLNFVLYMILIVGTLYSWFEHINYESLQGYHTIKVHTDYVTGFLLFLLSEIMFFVSIFWAYFHFALPGNENVGFRWPYYGIETISYLNLPLLNTLLLITSGLFVTWSHNALKRENYYQTYCGLLWTILLGSLFLIFQVAEYCVSRYNINDGAYGSVFYFGTGFHGLHVLLGTISLCYNFRKLVRGELSRHLHYSFLFTIWYWHFVDFIWLLLFLVFYIWK